MFEPPLPEILLVDKPVGISSFDVIRRLRRVYGVRKMGHAGTLDPLASGLMIVGVGAGTKRLTEYIKLDKEYVAEILLGEQRSTGDLEGEIIAEKPYADDLRSEVVTRELSAMITTLTLPVSAYSAIKKDGVPMYKRARKAAASGGTLKKEELPVRAMEVYEAELLETIAKNERLHLKVRFKVGSGTYIRSLGEELGRRLGYPATLEGLRRTKVGEWNVTEAMSLLND